MQMTRCVCFRFPSWTSTLALLTAMALATLFVACGTATERMIDTHEVGVTREVTKEVPVEVTREVLVEVPVEVPVEVIKEVPVEVEVQVEVTREVVREVPIEVTREVVREVPVQVTPAATAAPTRSPQHTPTAAPTPTPWPTATAAPTPTPRPTRASDTIDRYSNAIETAEDSDTYKIVQDATGPIEISVSGIPLGEPGETFGLHIDPDWPADSINLYSDERYIWRSVPRGVHSIDVSSAGRYNHFPYTIAVDTSNDNFAETTSAAHPLSSGQPYANAIDPDGDIDIFKIVQESTGPIEISVSGIPLGEPGIQYKLKVNPDWASP